MVASPALAYKMIGRGKPASVAKSVLTLTPAIDWNRMQARPGRNAESWTLDGLQLDEITFYGGIENGRALFREVDKRDKPLSPFQATMLAPNVAQLFEQSYRLAVGSSLSEVGSVEPATFAGTSGFRFTYSYTLGRDEVRRRGETTGAIVGGKQYMMTWEAPTIHYYDRNLADYRALVSSARLAAATSP